MKTSSIDLAASLMALQYELVKVDRTDPRRMEFHFEPSKPLPASGNLGELVKISMEDVKLKLANKTLTLNAQDVFDAMRRMKSLIHSS